MKEFPAYDKKYLVIACFLIFSLILIIPLLADILVNYTQGKFEPAMLSSKSDTYYSNGIALDSQNKLIYTFSELGNGKVLLTGWDLTGKQVCRLSAPYNYFFLLLI